MDYAAALLDENRAFGELIRGGAPDTPVPSCPDWNLKRLFRHVGRGDRWAAQIVAEQRDQPLDPRSVEGGKPPDDPDAAITWLHEGAQALLDAVAQVGQDAPVWSLLGPRPAGWWVRRRLHEAVVHRADAAQALGRDYLVAPTLAADGVGEWLDIVTSVQRDGPPPLDDGQTIHLHATDPDLGAEGEWTVRADNGGLSWAHEHGKGSVALRGPASDLLLALLRRTPVADTEIVLFGDDAVWRTWLDRTSF